jgi:hypothetical protein
LSRLLSVEGFERSHSPDNIRTSFDVWRRLGFAWQPVSKTVRDEFGMFYTNMKRSEVKVQLYSSN